jgi:hypothetical protein
VSHSRRSVLDKTRVGAYGKLSESAGETGGGSGGWIAAGGGKL